MLDNDEISLNDASNLLCYTYFPSIAFVIGTIGILDQLYNGLFIDKNEYEFCLLEMQNHNGQGVLLPSSFGRKLTGTFDRTLTSNMTA